MAALIDVSKTQKTYDEWLCSQTVYKKVLISNFFTIDEKNKIKNFIAENKSLRSIWLYFKDCGRMPFNRSAFSSWCKKEFGNQKRKNSTFSNSHSNPPAFSNNNVFRMDLPIDDDSLKPAETKPAETLPKNELAKNNYSHSIKSLVASYKRIGKEKFIEKLKEQEKEFDRQGIEGVFVLDKSLKI